jgi:hypothetical protein
MQVGLENFPNHVCSIYYHVLEYSWWRFGLEIRFIDHLQILTANHYNTIANFHTLPITTTHAKSFQSFTVSPSRSLATASNSGDSSTAPATSSLHRFPYNSLTASTDKVPGWPPLHTNLLVFSSQNDFLTTE